MRGGWHTEKAKGQAGSSNGGQCGDCYFEEVGGKGTGLKLRRADEKM